VESFEGMSGHIELNKVGDRMGGNYDFWTIGVDNDSQSYEWKKEDNSRWKKANKFSPKNCGNEI
jgi:hypothetical protein